MKYSNQSFSIDATVLNVNADWLVKFQAGEAGEDDQLAWRNQSPAHSAAWQHIQSLLNTFINRFPRKSLIVRWIDLISRSVDA